MANALANITNLEKLEEWEKCAVSRCRKAGLGPDWAHRFRHQP